MTTVLLTNKDRPFGVNGRWFKYLHQIFIRVGGQKFIVNSAMLSCWANKGIDAALLALELGVSERYIIMYQRKLGLRPLTGNHRKGRTDKKDGIMIRDLTGQIIGDLLVLAYVKRGHYNCECVCGRTVILRDEQLRCGQKKCGICEGRKIHELKAKADARPTKKLVMS